ncbi:immunoglobulin-like domain-containing protein [Acholeplasma equifetale]|uniref:immunoglobulin-like domain-containing protein n=1 Tax=Acholeplasma equifetale TaxID=264634 RepID=UPI00047C66AB|nr:immunoglobulin-like domain-containing protein [Acholeplasma equifetale]
MNTVFKKSWFKTMMSVVVAAFAIMFVVACTTPEKSDQDYVADAKGSLQIVYATGDSSSSVTKDITLASSVTVEDKTVTVTWSSSNTNIIKVEGQTGKVTRPEANTEVTLTATLKLNETTDTKEFKVTVTKAEVTPQEALQAIEIGGATYNSTTDRYETTGNLTLPTTSMGLTVSWTSNNTDLIKTDGTVTRPSWDSSDQLVQLTASINGVTRTFRIIVKKIDVRPVESILEEAYEKLLIANTTDGVSKDLVLPTTVAVDSYSVKVTWSSSNTDIIANNGQVFLPEEQTVVILTATLSLEGEEETLEKVFELTVLAGLEPEYSGDIAGLKEWGKTAQSNAYAKIEGVTVLARHKDGLMVADDTGILFIFTQAAPEEKYEVGKVFDFYGAFNFYYGAPQLQNATGKSVRGVASSAKVTELAPTVIDDFAAYIQAQIAKETSEADPYNKDNLFDFEYIQVEVKVRVQGSGNYDVFLVNPDYDGGNLDSSANSALTTNAGIIYYQSNIADVRLFDGLVVKMNLFLYSRRTDRAIYTFAFGGTADDIEPAATNEQIIDIVGEAIQANVAGEYAQAATISLPTSMLGATISYESDSPLVDVATGKVTMPESGQEEVTITATITREGETKTVTIKTKVGELPIIDVQDARDGYVKGASVRVQASITAMINARYFVLQDETGAISIYIGDNKSPFVVASSPTQTTIDGINAFWASYGNKLVELEGFYDTYNGNIYIVPMKITVKGTGSTYAPTDINDVELTKDGLAPYLAKNVSVSNLEITAKPSQQYGNILFTLKNDKDETISLFWDARTLLYGGNTVESITQYLNGFTVGMKVDLVGVTVNMQNDETPRFEFNALSNIKVHVEEPTTDEGKVDSAGANISIPEQTSASTITLPATGLWGTTITWTSSNDEVINPETGAVVVPTGLAVEVTLTAKVKLNDVEKEFEFVVLVGQPITSISEAHKLAADSFVRVQGIVIAKSVSEAFGNAQIYIQDETGGIQAFRATGEDANKVNVGDLVIWEGNVTTYQGMNQFAQPSATVKNQLVTVVEEAAGLPNPIAIEEKADLATAKLQLASVTGFLKETYATFEQSKYYKFVLATGEEVEFRIVALNDSSEANVNAIINKLTGKAAGTEITITSVVANASTPYFLITDADQLTVGSLGDDEVLAELALNALVLPENEQEVTENLTLPTTALFGFTVEWTSSNIDVIANNGTVTRGSSDEEVTLTYKVKKDDTVVLTGTIDVTVKAEGAVGPTQPVTVNMQWTSSSSNMDETTNYAETLGLNPDIFTVKAVKGSASSIIGIYTDLRIYGNRADGNGNSLVITIAAGYKITSITYKFGASNNNAIGTLAFDSGTPINLAIADVLNVDKTYSDLSASTITLKNTHSGGDKNGQIRIDGISITYISVTE